jgi:SNF2 family DNA or RNA helicase
VKYTPRPWQPPITEHILEHPRCAVFAGMGSGKTGATLTAIAHNDILLGGPSLILAPKRVAQTTWPDEVVKWDHLAGLECVPVLGDERQRKRSLALDRPLFSINYEQLPWLVEHCDPWPFKTVVADELTRLKGFRTRQGGSRARALARVAHSLTDRFIGLTGTPAPNGLADLWGQAWFIDRGERLGRSFSAFEQRWFRKGFNGFGLEPLPFAQEQIQRALADVAITVDPGDYMSIDEPIVTRVPVTLAGRARELYRRMEREMFLELAGEEIEAFNAAARTNKCLQLANGFIYHEDGQHSEVHDLKIDALRSIVEEAAGMPVLVAYHYKADLERLLKAFPQGRVLDAKTETIRAWNAGNIPVLFAHPASAGHGLNLQDGGNIMVFFSMSWNLEEHDQIIERIGPMRQMQAGHNRPVYVYYILAVDTVDELVYTRLESKRSVQDILLDAMRREIGGSKG